MKYSWKSALKHKLWSAGGDRQPFSQLPVVSLSCIRNLGHAGVLPVPKARPCARPLRLCCRACRSTFERHASGQARTLYALAKLRRLDEGLLRRNSAVLEARVSGGDSLGRLRSAARALRRRAQRSSWHARQVPALRRVATTGPASERCGAAALTGLSTLPAAAMRAPERPHADRGRACVRLGGFTQRSDAAHLAGAGAACRRAGLR